MDIPVELGERFIHSDYSKSFFLDFFGIVDLMKDSLIERYIHNPEML